MEMELNVIEAFVPLYSPKRIKSFFGGRGAAKSQEVAQYVIHRVDMFGDKYVCAREFQNSIEDSSYSLLVHKIFELGIQENFDIQATKIIHKENGGKIDFVGLARNIMSFKSKFGYNGMWIEEAETVSKLSWDTLIPTIREEDSEIIATWNTGETGSYTYELLAAPYIEEINQKGFYEDEYIYAAKVCYWHNPYFGEPLKTEMERSKATNYKEYLNIWCGEPKTVFDDSIIEAEWVDAAIDAHLKLPHLKPRGEIVTAFDPADEGKDAKAIAYRHGVVLLSVKQKKDGDLDDAIAWAFDEAFENRSEILVYDWVGVGAGVKVGLKERISNKSIIVHGFGGGESPTMGKYKDDRKNEDVFLNKRAQYWWLLRDRFENTYKAVVKGEYIDPRELISISSEGMSKKDLEQLKSEFIRQQRKRTSGSRLIQLVSKAEMKKRGIPSPNMADSVAMSFAIDDIPKKTDVKPIPLGRRSGWMS